MNQKDIYVYQILSKIISKLGNLKSLILSLNTDILLEKYIPFTSLIHKK
jgi:hypothetical protein